MFASVPSLAEYAAFLPSSGEGSTRLETKRVSCSDWHTTMTKMAMEIGKMIIMMMMIKMISMLKQHWSST